MSKMKIPIDPQLIHSTVLMVHLGYISTTTPPWPLVPPLIPPTINSLPTSIMGPSTSCDLCRFSCAHLFLQHHLQHHHTTTSPPHVHPIPGPCGCYVHTWHGSGGLCPSLLDWVLLQHCHQVHTKPCRAGLPTFPPTIISLDDSLSPGLGTITHPSNLK